MSVINIKHIREPELRILENQEVPSNIEGENSEGALTINARVEEDSNGASTED